MKSKLLIGSLLGLFLATFVSCGTKDESKNGTEDMSVTCYLLQTNALASNPTASSPCNYNYSANPGFQSLNNGYNNPTWGIGGGLYGGGWGSNWYGGTSTPTCGSSMQMVYSPTKGLGCVNRSYLHMNGQPVYYTYNPATVTFVQSSTQYAGYNPYNPYGGMTGVPTGAATVLRVCDDSEPCPNNQHCRSPQGPYASGAIGICYY